MRKKRVALAMALTVACSQIMSMALPVAAAGIADGEEPLILAESAPTVEPGSMPVQRPAAQTEGFAIEGVEEVTWQSSPEGKSGGEADWLPEGFLTAESEPESESESEFESESESESDSELDPGNESEAGQGSGTEASGLSGAEHVQEVRADAAENGADERELYGTEEASGAEESVEESETAAHPEEAPGAQESVEESETAAYPEEAPGAEETGEESESVVYPAETSGAEETGELSETAVQTEETSATEETGEGAETVAYPEETSAAETGQTEIFMEDPELSVLEAETYLAGEEVPEEPAQAEYSIGFPDLREGDHTWLFSDEEYVLTADTSGLEGLGDYRLVWSAAIWDWDENGTPEVVFSLDDTGTYWSETEDPASVTLHGAALNAAWKTHGSETRWCNIYVSVMQGETEICGAFADYCVLETCVDYHFPDTRWEPTLLEKGGVMEVPGTLGVYVQDSAHPDGEELTVPVTDVTVESGSCGENGEWLPDTENPAVASVEKDEATGGWKITGSAQGQARVTLTYQLYGTEEDTAVFSYEIHVQEDYYRLNILYPEENEQLILAAGQEITVGTSVSHITINEDGTQNEEPLERYAIEIADHEVDGNLFDVENGAVQVVDDQGNVQEDGSGQFIRIRASENIAWGEETSFSVYLYPNEVAPLHDGGSGSSLVKLRVLGREDFNGCIEFDNLLEGNGRDTWMYRDGDYRMDVRTDGLNGLGPVELAYEVLFRNWEIEDESEPGACTDIPEECYTAAGLDAEDGASVTLHGQTLYDLWKENGEQTILVRAKVIAGGQEVYQCEASVNEIREPEIGYDPLLQGEADGNCVLLGRSVFIPDELGCWVSNSEYPFGSEELSVPVSDVQVLRSCVWDDTVEPDAEGNCWVELDTASEPDRRIVSLDVNGDQTGWDLYAENCGYVVLGITYTPYGEETPVTVEEELFVNGDQYNLGWHYPNESDQMLVNGTMDITTEMWRDWNYGEEDHGSEDITDYSLEICCNDDGSPCYDTNAMTAEVLEDGKTLRVTALDQDGWYDIQVVATARIDNGDGTFGECSVCCWIGFQINRDGYYVLRPVSLMTGEGENVSDYNPVVGGDLDLNKFGLSVSRIDAESPDEGTLVDGSAVRFRLEYDENAWAVKEASGDTPAAEQAFPLLTRKENWNTGVTVIAEMNQAGEGEQEDWQEVTRREYGFWEEDYHFDFLDLRGDGSTWIYTNEELAVSLEPHVPDAAASAVAFEWVICSEFGEDGEPMSDAQQAEQEQPLAGIEGHYNVFGDGSSAALYGAKLSELAKGTQAEGGEGFPDLSARVIMKVSDIEVSREYISLSFREPVYEYELPCQNPYENVLVAGQSYRIDRYRNCYVEDGNHPDGGDAEFRIISVSLQDQVWDDTAEPDENGEYWTDVENGTVSELYEDEDGWNIQTTENGGRVRVDYQYESVTPTEDSSQFGGFFDLYANGDRYYADYFYPGDSDQMLTGSEMTVTTSLRHEGLDYGQWYDEPEEDYWLELAQADEQGNPCYDTNLVSASVTEDGKSICIRSNENGEYGGTDLFVSVMRNMESEQGPEPQEVCAFSLHVNVCDYFTNLLPETLKEGGEQLCPQYGETVDFSAFGRCVMETYVDENGQKQEIKYEEGAENLRFRLEFDAGEWEAVGESAPASEDSAAWMTTDAAALRRITAANTHVSVVAEQYGPNEEGADEWRELARRDYWFGELWYDELAFDFSYGPNEDGEVFALIGSPLTVTADLSVLNEEARTEARLGNWSVQIFDGERQEEIPAEGVTLTVAEDGNSAVLEGVERHEGEYINLRATVYLGDAEIGNLYSGVKVCGESLDLLGCEDGVPATVLVGDDLTFLDGTAYVRLFDAEHPAGAVIRGHIENVEIPQAEDGSVIAETSVNAHGDRCIRGTVPGEVFAVLTLSNAEVWGSGTQDVYFPLAVLDSIEYLEISTDRGGTELLPGGTLQLQPRLVHKWVDENGGQQEEEVSAETYELRYESEDETLVMVDENGLVSSVSPRRLGGTSVILRVVKTAEDGSEAVTGGEIVWVEVKEEYFRLHLAQDTFDAYQGSTLTLEPEILRFNAENPDGIPVDGSQVTWKVEEAKAGTLTADGLNVIIARDLEVADSEQADGRMVWFDLTVCFDAGGGNEVSLFASAQAMVRVCSHEDWQETDRTEATCTEAGSVTSVCGICGVETKTEELAPLGHDCTKTEKTDANCTEAGHAEYWTCVRCGKVYADAAFTNETTPESLLIPAKGHTPVSAGNGAAATCTAAGKEADTKCQVCGTLIRTGATIPAKGHTPVSAGNGAAATCTAAGKEADTKCQVCGTLIRTGVAIPKLSHTPAPAENGCAATCTAAGKEADTRCKVCGTLIKEGAVIPAKGHTPVSAGNGAAATCTAAGKEADTKCKVCGTLIKEGTVIPASGHRYDAGKVTTPATALRDGVKTYTCTVCGAAKTEAVPAYGQTDIGTMSAELNSLFFLYDGKEKKPAVTVSGLTEGEDYTVAYSNNVNIGTAKAVITGCGDYKGTLAKTFTIGVKKGASYKVGSLKVKITKASVNGKGTVTVTGPVKKSVTSVSVPATVKIGGVKFSVTEISKKAFSKCTKLKKVKIGSKVTKIGTSAFANSTKLTSVTIGSAVKSIGTSAFSGCKVLKSITVPAKVTTIGSKAFYKCAKLSKITVKSKSLKKVGSSAFKGIYSKAKIKVPSSKLKAYKKLLKGKGQGAKVKITK